MVKWVAKKLATSILSRWILGGVVTLILGGSYAWWHSHKEGLREEGIQECVQEINQATVDALQIQLEKERAANADLRASLVAAAVANQEAVKRRGIAEENLSDIRRQMENQREVDPNYEEWSDTALPSGVADRLRQAKAQGQSDNRD